jgi:hypothetical protein
MQRRSLTAALSHPNSGAAAPKNHGVTGPLVLCAACELVAPLLVPYWSLVPPWLQPAKTKAAAAPTIKIIFFIFLLVLTNRSLRQQPSFGENCLNAVKPAFAGG